MAGQQCGGRVSVPWTPPQGPVVVPAGPTHSGGGRPFRRSSVARRGLTMDQPPPQFRGPGPKMLSAEKSKRAGAAYHPTRCSPVRPAMPEARCCPRPLSYSPRVSYRLASSSIVQVLDPASISIKPRNHAQRRKEGQGARSRLFRCRIPESRKRAPAGRRTARRA